MATRTRDRHATVWVCVDCMYAHAGIRRRVIETGLTLEQAQAHCQNPETSSSTATGKVGRERTRKVGDWFDGYEHEGDR